MTMAPMTDGGPSLDLATLTGPAVVNLWATWCGPCRRELPAFQEVSETRTEVRFIGIDIGEDAAKARDYLDELGVTFEQFVDEDGGLTDALGAASLPVTLVVAPDGSVATEHLGPMSVDELNDAIDALPTT
jgi:thiol-disulfide isomerase/thioredoxin